MRARGRQTPVEKLAINRTGMCVANSPLRQRWANESELVVLFDDAATADPEASAARFRACVPRAPLADFAMH